MAYNNAYVEGRLGLFRHAGAMRLIPRKARLAGVELHASPVEPNGEACPAFHIKGMCNTGYGNAEDHVAHTWEQDLPLWGWDVRAMPETTVTSAPVTQEIGRGAERVLPVPTKNPALSLRTRALTTPSTNTQSTTIKKRTSLRMKTLEPDAKRPDHIPWPKQALLLDDIGKYVVRDAEAVTRLGWKEFMRRRQGRGDVASLLEVKHPARRLLRQ